jgi:hypothetical protein
MVAHLRTGLQAAPNSQNPRSDFAPVDQFAPSFRIAGEARESGIHNH